MSLSEEMSDPGFSGATGRCERRTQGVKKFFQGDLGSHLSELLYLNLFELGDYRIFFNSEDGKRSSKTTILIQISHFTQMETKDQRGYVG